MSLYPDRGNNFGRLARTGLMDAYIDEMLELPLAGIAAKEWIRFFTGDNPDRCDPARQACRAPLPAAT